MRKLARRGTAPVQQRNAALLAPVASAGTSTYRQPWDSTRGITYGHDRESLVAAVTTAIARDVADTSRFVTRAELLGTGEDYTEQSHYCFALNVAPAQGLTASSLWQHLTLGLLYCGEAYLVEVNKTLTPLVGGTVEITPGGKNARNADGSPMLIAGYTVRNVRGDIVGTYGPDGSAIASGAIPGSILHRVYLPHPENPLRANAPIAQAGLPVDVLHYWRSATKSLLLNDGMPSAVLTVDDPDIDLDSLEELERRVNSRQADTSRKGRTLVINSGAKFETPGGGSPLSADWVSLAESFRQDVLTVFRTPDSVLGRGGARTYENQAVEQRAYTAQVLVPLRTMVLDALNLRARRLGYVLVTDVAEDSMTPFEADAEQKMSAATANLVNAGVLTINEARERHGLPPIDGGDELRAPVAPVPLLDVARAVEADASPHFERAVARKVNADRFSDAIDSALAEHEDKLVGYAQRFHDRLARNIAGAIRRKAGGRRAVGDEPMPPITADEVLDVAARDKELLADLPALMGPAMEAVAATVATQLGVEPAEVTSDLRWKNLLAERIERLVEGRNDAGQLVYRGWTREIHAELREALAAAYQNGESVDGALTRVDSILGTSGTPSAGYRAERIARTEMIGLANASARAQMAQSGVVSRKQWYSIGDSRTRDSHASLNGTVVGIDEQFSVNGYPADGPHADGLPASEVVNCRCRLIPLVD